MTPDREKQLRYKKDTPLFDEVNELIRYVPETGAFYSRTTNKRCEVSTGNRGKRIRLWGTYWNAAKIAHLLQTLCWPEDNPSYGEGGPTDTRWENIVFGPTPADRLYFKARASAENKKRKDYLRKKKRRAEQKYMRDLLGVIEDANQQITEQYREIVQLKRELRKLKGE